MIHSKLSPMLLSLLLAEPARALQILNAQDGQTVFGKISRTEITRLALDHGRIRKIVGNTGEFVLEKDEEKGQVFIRPVEASRHTPLNLFLSTETGTLALVLQLVDGPSDTLLLRTAGAHAISPSTGAASGQHVRALKALLKALATATVPAEMDLREPVRAVPFLPGTRLVLQRALIGEHLVGETYALANLRETPLEVPLTAWSPPGLLAVSLEHARLLPGATTAVFILRARTLDD